MVGSAEMAHEQELNGNEMEESARLTILEHDVESIKNTVNKIDEVVNKGNGRESLKTRMNAMERAVEQTLNMLQSHIDTEKHNAERKIDRNLKIILQTIAIIGAIFISAYFK